MKNSKFLYIKVNGVIFFEFDESNDFSEVFKFFSDFKKNNPESSLFLTCDNNEKEVKSISDLNIDY